MRKLFFILISLFFATAAFGQNKYFIYFEQKEVSSKELSKSPEVLQEVEEGLSKKSIERRKRKLNENYITEADIPVNPVYIEKVKNTGAEIVHTLNWFNSVSAFLTDEQKNAIEKFSFVKKIEHVRSLKAEVSAGEDYAAVTQFGYGSALTQMNLSEVPEVHEAGITGEGVLIGILDTGFKWKTHPALENANVIAERDFVFGDSITENEAGDSPDQHNHGTSVFSLIGGFLDDKYIGSSFNSSFLLAKTEDVASETRVEEDNYAAALEWLEKEGADIVTSSLGYSDFDGDNEDYTYEDMDGNTTLVSKALNIAFDLGIVTVTSAGNEGNDKWFYISSPADAYNVLAVGAVNASNQVTGFSSNGPTSDGRIKPEVTAMGQSVYVASASGGYYTGNGTSFSAPIVAGVTGLLLSAHPHLTNSQVRDIIIKTADESESPNNKRGYGLASAARAIEYPNIRITEYNQLHLIKTFLAEEEISSSSVFVDIIENNGEFETSVQMMNSGENFIADLPLDEGVYNFTISYEDKNGVSVKLPKDGLYTFDTSDYLIKTVTSVQSPSPETYALYNNYPNPFNISTTIRFQAKEVEQASVIIYNMLGQRVRTLFSGNASPGENRFIWNGRNDAGEVAASGPYIYSLRIGGEIYSKKMMLLK